MPVCFPDDLVCPYCSSKDYVGNGVKEQIFVDIPIHNRPTRVPVDRQRFRCKYCKKTFWQKIEGIDERRNISLRLIAFIEKESLNRSFLSVARETGLSEGTIRRIFSEYVARLEAEFRTKTPDILSFDLITLIGKTRYLPTNFKTHGIIGFLEDSSKDAVERYLQQLEEKWRIRKVVIDANPGVRDVAKYYLPDAQVAINPGHILDKLLRILETIRTDTRKGLSAKDLRLLTNDKQIIRKSLDELTAKDKESPTIWEKRFRKGSVKIFSLF